MSLDYSVQNLSKVVVGVGGGIAAYKAIELCSLLKKRGIDVRVAMSDSAQKFIQPLTFASITQNPVYENVFDKQDSYIMEHITWAKWADALVIAPATADLIAKLAQGMADDPITTLYLAFRGSVYLAPAMNTNMWQHPAVINNLDILQQRGVHIIEPSEGVLACGDIGAGRLEEPINIVKTLFNDDEACLPENQKLLNQYENFHFIDDVLKGKNILITSGPTHEYIDPVRYISNPSSGKMGAALALAAAARGANVHLVTGPVSASNRPDWAVSVYDVTTADQMLDTVSSLADEMDIFIFAAAVGDYKAALPMGEKIKRTGEPIQLSLVENDDISQLISSLKREEQITIGFAAETSDHLENALEKIKNKNLNAIVLNDVSDKSIGFNSSDNAVTWIQPDSEPISFNKKSKEEIAREIISQIIEII